MGKMFKKDRNVLDKKKANRYQELMNHLEKVQKNLERDYQNIQFIEDRNLVDYYTYRIKAEEARYDYLLQEAKKVETGIYL